MADKNRLSSVGVRAGNFAANHPRALLLLVLLVLFVAVQGSAAAGLDLAGTTAAGGGDTGP